MSGIVPGGRKPVRRAAPEPVEEQKETLQGGEFALEKRDWANMQPVLDPKPMTRLRWEKKMIIREIRRRGRLTKEEKILRTEREFLSKSHWFKTSIKKLGPLARQIAGKNIDEAILQMRFSKKKVAKDVLEHLQHARDMAVVQTGMGLGAPTVDGESDSPAEHPERVKITLKSGARKTISDPNSIYISQAWVNRGPYDFAVEHRARGRINRLYLPYTSLSVILKEERTRIREWKDREELALRQRKSQLWTQLPDRKISQQNQYYSW